MSVTFRFFHGFMEKVCHWFKDSGEILKNLIIKMRRTTEMVIERLRSTENSYYREPWMLWILICPLYSLSACELLKSSKLLKDGLFPVNHHDIIHFKFQLQFHPVGREVGGGIWMGKTCEPKAFSFQCMTKFTTNKKKIQLHLIFSKFSMLIFWLHLW